MITKIDLKNKIIKTYAIRKLTPNESFRLMGVSEENIRKIQSNCKDAKKIFGDYTAIQRMRAEKNYNMVISKTQQYKMAGNSIVVDVLKFIYEQIWYPKNCKCKRQLDFIDDLFPGQALPPNPHNENNDEKIFITTFSGYDSQLMAADKLKKEHPDFRYTCSGWSEIDRSACLAHNLVFPQYADKNLGDITAINWFDVKESLKGRDIDMFTYSSPCQDISVAGLNKGIEKGQGTRSSLLWDVENAIKILRPKYLLQENVDALINKNYKPYFQKWLEVLKKMGYISRYAILNSKDYGIPQNRKRLFCLSMRNDIAFDFHFPKPIRIDTKLEDILECKVPEKYFLKDKVWSKYLQMCNTGNHIFVQYDLPPCHEAAEHIKKWINTFIDMNNGWAMNKDELLKKLQSLENEIYDSFKLHALYQ